MATEADTTRIATDALEQVIGDATALERQRNGLTAPARELHASLLRFFERHGRPPHREELVDLGADAGLDSEGVELSLGALERGDLAVRDERGDVLSAYPYSGMPTRHLVEFADGGSVYAMCAVDALGIPLMTGRAATVISSDPSSGQPVRVTVTDRGAAWEPRGPGVFVGRQAGEGTIAETCCRVIDFFASADAAEAYHRDRRTAGMWLDQAQALEAGRLAFATMLDDAGAGKACGC
jgi:hypothetical protein